MQISEPHELIRLCYQHGLQQIPVSENGSIQGSIRKKDLVRHMRKSDGFDRGLVQTIDELTRPAQQDLLEDLRDKLRSGEISGIPVLNYEGSITRTITPGVLEAEEESRKYLDQADQRELYERLLEELPFPVQLLQDGELRFENKRAAETKLTGDRWGTREWERQGIRMILYLPKAVDEALSAMQTLRAGESFDLRDTLETVETAFLREAHDRTSTTSEAAKRVELPRQTFNYRWKNRVEPSD